MHVLAKRYLCAVDSGYRKDLSEASRASLRLQGGPLEADELADFESLPFWRDAVRLRRWDDLAKREGVTTPPLRHFNVYLEAVFETNQL